MHLIQVRWEDCWIGSQDRRKALTEVQRRTWHRTGGGDRFRESWRKKTQAVPEGDNECTRLSQTDSGQIHGSQNVRVN